MEILSTISMGVTQYGSYFSLGLTEDGTVCLLQYIDARESIAMPIYYVVHVFA
jgi:hypothetical protein